MRCLWDDINVGEVMGQSVQGLRLRMDGPRQQMDAEEETTRPYQSAVLMYSNVCNAAKIW